MPNIPDGRPTIFKRFALHWSRFWFEPTSPGPVCLFRIFFGILALVNGLLYMPDFLTWFGAQGAAPMEAIQKIHPAPWLTFLLWWKPGDAFFAALLFTYLVATFFVIIGLRTQFSLIVVWLLLISFYQRNPEMWHHVDILLRIFALALVFAPAGEMYSVDSWLKDPPSPPRRFAPWAQRLIQFQMCMVYLEAFCGKMGGEKWRSGSAVYYATHFPDGMRTAVPAFLDHGWFYSSMTYFTLGIEFCLCFLVWYRPWRYWILLVGLIFHLGIHYFLNLDLLEFGIMITYICFLDPPDIERAFRFFKASPPVAAEESNITEEECSPNLQSGSTSPVSELPDGPLDSEHA